MKRLIQFLAFALVSSAGAEELDWCGTRAGGSRDAWLFHRYWARAGARGEPAATSVGRYGHVALLEDRRDLITRKNPLDLDGRGLRFVPNAAGGYDVVPVPPLGVTGTLLALGGDDAALAVDLPFAFRFYGRSYDQVFVHADGLLSFGAPYTASADRGLARFVSGPPAIAPFFTNLDPSRGGGVKILRSGDRMVVSWEDIPGSGQQNRNTVSAALYPSGAIEVGYSRLESREGIVGVTPGDAVDLTAVDLTGDAVPGNTGALVEAFSETERLDLLATVRRFLRSVPDVFDQIIVYATRPLNPLPGSLAFQITVNNGIDGIGLPLVDDAALWGSGGSLASVVYMDSIDLYLEVDGFEILAHEVGHRWLARMRFAGPGGAGENRLLGSGGVHWSFFFDSDGSFLGGNDIQDLGNGRFETVDLVSGYGPLDQYAMGLRAAAEVPVLFYVEEADNFRPNRGYRLSSGPEGGVRFTGRRVPVRIEDVVSAMGPRRPDASRAPKGLRQAYILVHDAEAPPTEPRVKAVERIRSRFEGFYRDATDGRGYVDSSLP